MTRASAFALWSAVLLMPGASGCVRAVVVPCVPPCHTPMASRLTDLQLASGAEVIVDLVGGETVRGAVKDQRSTELDLLARVPGDHDRRRTIAEADIQTIARLVGMSKRKRVWLGAAVGAAASLPFSISMFGDMVVPGAIGGALFGRGSGDVRTEVIFERGPQPKDR
jgi:hypothetical protein